MKIIGITRYSAKGLLIAVLLLISLGCFAKLSYIQVKASLAQVLLNHAWENTQLAYIERGEKGESKENQLSDTLAKIKPWPWADVYPVAKLVMPRLKLSYLVLNNDSGQALAFGPGITATNTSVSNTALSNKTKVISGHRDSHFEFLAEVVIGDDFSLALASGKVIHYRVNRLSVIDIQKNQLYLPDIEENQSQGLVLITCYPFNSMTASTPFRLVIEGSEIKQEIMAKN